MDTNQHEAGPLIALGLPFTSMFLLTKHSVGVMTTWTIALRLQSTVV
ncbi:MAG TPA: hypothetical protein PLY87_28940 [Planctomycetaceae bacterium]|nr:hypothetical protein [Planctomycetaceae bacterium]HQZ69162.1 hypothetical protein [Planctomycetaceae bacterium]